MSLKVMDGARTLDGANSTCDIAHQTLTVGATAQANSAGVDMTNFFEVMAHVNVLSTAAGCTLTVYGQESDDNSTFTNISGSSQVIAPSQANDSVWLDVNWKNPTRKRYFRVSALATGANAAILSAATLRVGPHGGDMTVDDSFDEVA